MKPFHIALGLTAAVALPHAAPAQAQDPPGLTCTLSVDGGRTQFQQGEVIRLTLAFTSGRPGVYRMARWPWAGRGFEAFHVSPSEGTADPQADVPAQTFFTYNGPPPPDPVPIGATPVTAPLIVNESLRFDRPGIYRLYVTSRRVLDGHAKQNDFSVTGKTYTVSSSAVQFQVVPADPTWAHAQAQAALAEVQGHYSGPMTIPARWDVLTALDTPESARALLSLLAADTAPRSSESPERLCRPGLIGYPDQAWLVAEMEHDLAAPGFPVTQGFLDTLTDLATWRKTPRVYGDGRRKRAYWLRAAGAVAAKTDAARPMTLHTLLETAWIDPGIGQGAAVRARLPGLARWMALDFDRLPPLPQDYLLGDEWARFRSPALLPALRRLWKTAGLSENSDTFQPHNAALNGLVLRRLYDLSPREGRALILAEAARPRPRADLAALGALPDATLPTLDRTLAARLAARQDTDATCQLVARYATPAVFPQARTFYAQPQDWSTQTSLLAYFLRVSPEYGTALLHRALLKQLGRGNTELLIGDVACEHYDAALERFVVAELDNPDPGIVADAARTLGVHGSAATEAALWTRLRKPDAAPKSRAVVEQGVALALATGQEWYAGPTRLRAIRALCVTAAVRAQMDDLLRRVAGGQVYVDYEQGDPSHWGVGQYNSEGRAAFLAKLTQFPAGTAFLWQDIGFGPDEEHLFREAQTITQAHGEVLKRWRPKPLAFSKT